MISFQRFLRVGLLAGALGGWYGTHRDRSEAVPIVQKYHLPDEVPVKRATVPTYARPSGPVVRTNEINFSRNFEIVTDRYRLIRDEDYWISQQIGWFASLPRKLFFWDYDIGQGLDADHARAVFTMLEANKDLSGITVRINHNEALADLVRLFSDPRLEERNNWFARITVGVTTAIYNELWAELGRGDYYNPMTQTAVLYSNVDAIPAHELGHHQDYQRFESDWWYSLARPVPSVMLFQEWQASAHARETLSPEEKIQFERYLIPAFFTYLLLAYLIARRTIYYDDLKAYLKRRDIRTLDKSSARRVKREILSQIGFLQTVRRLAGWNVNLLLGARAFSLLTEVTGYELAGAAGFVGTFLLSDYIWDKVTGRVLPYYHERISV